MGWFLVGAARQERKQTVVRHGLAGLRVADVMVPTPVLAPAWFTVNAFLRDYVAWRPSDRPAGGVAAAELRWAPAGLVTVAALASVPPSQRHAVRAGDVAVPTWAVITTRPDEPVTGLLDRLQGGAGIAVVVTDGAVVGLVTQTAIVHPIQRGQPPGPPARPPAAPTTAAGR